MDAETKKLVEAYRWEVDVELERNLLVKQHAAEATVNATMLSDAMLDKGDLDGQRVWLRILKAIDELLAKRPGLGQKLH